MSNLYNDGKVFISKVSPSGEILENEWVGGIQQPTGISMTGDKLYITDSQKGLIYRLSGGIMEEWLQSDDLVKPNGRQELLLNTTAPGRNCAAFKYILSKRLLVIPTLEDNRVVAYELK